MVPRMVPFGRSTTAMTGDLDLLDDFVTTSPLDADRAARLRNERVNLLLPPFPEKLNDGIRREA